MLKLVYRKEMFRRLAMWAMGFYLTFPKARNYLFVFYDFYPLYYIILFCIGVVKINRDKSLW